MAERIPQSTSYLVVFRSYLAADGSTPATGKTIAITISKNGATSFSNPNAGATNATEMASGFYKFTLDTTDTGTLGPLAWRGAQADINDAGDVLSVVLPNAPANVTQISGGSTAADNLRRSAEGIYYGTITGAADTTTLIDSGLTQSGSGHWNGRIVIFLTGTLAKQATDITAFDPATDKITFTTVTGSPSGGDTYVIV